MPTRHVCLIYLSLINDYSSAANAKQEYEVFGPEIAEIDIEPNSVTSDTMQQIKQETAKDYARVSLCYMDACDFQFTYTCN